MRIERRRHTRGGVGERLEQGVPGERRALDPHRELDDALQRLEVAELDLDVGDLFAVGTLILDRHHPLEPAHQGAHLGDGLPLTAWLIIDAELCEIEQPWPPTLTSRHDVALDRAR